MVHFFVFIGKFQVFELVLGLKFALRHSRRLATRDLRECMILVGGPKGTYKNLVCAKGAPVRTDKMKIFFDVFSMKNVSRLEENC
jgi:hypothetical protein